ncbi:MAG: tyrosine recombinase XerC [Clostridia bacterium]|nr:tyrosine recombinase XerC [Clostridia bacterium]
MDYRLEAPDVIRRFLTYTETIRGKSRKTVEEYYLDLRLFFRYIKRLRGLVPPQTDLDEIPVSDVDISLVRGITLSDIYDFMSFLARERAVHQNSTLTGYGLGAAARARKVASLRSYFKYIHSKEHLIDENPAAELESSKLKKSLPRHLTLEESKNLLNSVDGDNAERDFCILTLFLNCGLRVSELVGINLSDIKEDTLRITGKGGKERIVYLNDACISALLSWVTARKELAPSHEQALFISRLRTRISPSTVKWLVKKHLGAAGLSGENYSAHKLRHTAATLMYQNGVDVLVLQQLLGHEQLNTTKIYTHVDNSDLRIAAKANPLSGEVKQVHDQEEDEL